MSRICQKCCNLLFSNGIGATIEGRQVRRIGHKHANARNPRPILVTMNNVTTSIHCFEDL